MRCLTLVDRFQQAGAECAFVCARLDGNLIDYIRSKGFSVLEMPSEGDVGSLFGNRSGEIENDACCTRLFAEDFKADWIVLDHYGLDASWETAAVPEGAKLLVLDDLANRNHRANVLVDQNLGRTADEYRHLVPPSCEVLTGSRYAMLRRDFPTYRETSLHRRASGTLNSVLISFGGADSDNVTGQILELFADSGLHQSLESLVVVLGSQSVWKEETAAVMAEFGGRGRLLCGVDNMAEIMSAADLSIGGGGTTAWERCCLGLPSLLLSIADNQIPICESLDDAGAAFYLGDARSTEWRHRLSDVLQDLIRYPDRLTEMSHRASAICDGLGADRLVSRIVEID